ncbi:MAG: beta-lactamase family protein [Acidobacteriia bacterium]|nr:beta-lactamase family protein [Terriglobia bacterium]
MRVHSFVKKLSLLFCFLFCTVTAASPQAPPVTARPDIDDIVTKALAASGVPSVSVAIVEGGKLTYVKAYGQARLDPPLPARTDMRYSIGSISKQFTAAAILMLAEEGKLSLDDHVEKFVPGLTRGNEITVRQLLSHTSGYQDYWPQDYVPPFMLATVTPQKIVERWARKPLDFEPGARWQYSNTNFVIAGMIVDKASHMPFLDFLRQRIFKPLHMESVADIDQNTLAATDATGYFRYALGPPRVAPKEGKGWLFAAGELAMTAADLQKWNIALLQKGLLKPSSYKELETETHLKDGSGTNYSLGIRVNHLNGHLILQHTGEVSGFTGASVVLPDDGVAVVVLVNQDAVDAASVIIRAIVAKLVAINPPPEPERDERVKKILEGLAHGQIDRALFSDNGNAYFSDVALKDYAASLSPLGAVENVRQTSTGKRGGMTFWDYTARYSGKAVAISVYALPDGKIEQFLVSPQQ